MSEFTEKLNSSELISNAWDEIDRDRASAGLLIDVIKIEFKDWQPPKELVEVPQCVDVAIRSLSNGDRGAYDAIYLIKCKIEQYRELNTDWFDVYDWIFEKGNSAIFEKAFLEGYTIEKPKEKLYFVKLPNAQLEMSYMCKSCSKGEAGYHEEYSSKNSSEVHFGSKYNQKYYGGWQRQFTEQEIKAIDEKYWAFAVEVED